MRKKLIIIAFTLMLLLPTSVFAKCSNAEVIRLQKIANNISDSKTYHYVNDQVKFNITLTNVTNDVYLYDFIKRQNLYATGGPITQYDYNDGMTIRYVVKSNLDNCRGDTIRNISVVLPSYNNYYSSDLCEGISSYSLCRKWYNTKNLSYDDFEKQVRAYRKSLEDKPIDVPVEKHKKTWQELAFELFSKSYIIILVPIIIIAGGGIYILKKNEEII